LGAVDRIWLGIIISAMLVLLVALGAAGTVLL
jgi:hypothetical protein